MIRTLREQLTDRGFRIILIIALGSFVFASVIPVFYSLFSNKPEEGVYATINNIDVTTDEVARKIQVEQSRRDMFRQQFGKEANNFLAMFGMTGSIENFVFDKIKFEKVIDSLARDINLEIAPDYILSQLQDKNFLENELGLSSFVDPLGRVDMESLKMVLRQQGLSISDLERDAERSLRRSFVQKFIQAAAYVPNYIVRQQYIKDNVARKYTVMIFDRDHYLKEAGKQKVSDEDLTQFFDRENRKNKRYLKPEERSGYFFKFDPLSYGIEVSDKEVETKYNRTKKNYLVTNEIVNIRKKVFPFDSDNKNEIRNQAEDALAEIKQNSKKIESAKIESIERGKSKDKKLSRAAFGLTQDGEISDIIEIKDNFIILQRVTKDSAQYKSLPEVRDEIKDGLLIDKFKRRFPQDVRRALNEEKIESFLKEKGALKNTITHQVSTDDVIIKKLFTIGLDKYGYIFDHDQGYIVKVADIQKAHFPALNDVKDAILVNYYEAQADDALNKAVQGVYDEILAHKTREIDSMPGLTQIFTNFVNPHDQDEINKLKSKGIDTQSLFDLAVPKSLHKGFSDKKGFIIRLDEVAEIDENDFEKQSPSLKETLLKQTERSIQNGFVADLLKNAKINMYTPNAGKKQR